MAGCWMRRRSENSERGRRSRTKLEKQGTEFRWVTASLTSLPRIAECACGRVSDALRLRAEQTAAGEAERVSGRAGEDDDVGSRTGVVGHVCALPVNQRCQWAVQKVRRIWSSASDPGTWSLALRQTELHMPLTWYGRQRRREPSAVFGDSTGGVAAIQRARRAAMVQPGIDLNRPKTDSL